MMATVAFISTEGTAGTGCTSKTRPALQDGRHCQPPRAHGPTSPREALRAQSHRADSRYLKKNC